MNKPIEVTLLSRRHTAKAGTRFHQRGIDEGGNVANFVETELIVRYNNGETVFSHVQVRGSVPLFWSQKAKKSTKVSFKDNRAKNKMAFNKHFDELIGRYGRVFVLNLLSQADKPDEARLGNAMFDLLQERQDEKLQSHSYDFHAKVTGGNFEDILRLMSELQGEIMSARYRFFIHGSVNNRTYRQGGVVRTNCLDCLDRTNFVQAHISYQILAHILSFLVDAHRKNDPHAPTLWDARGEKSEIEQALQRMWNENGDKLSN